MVMAAVVLAFFCGCASTKGAQRKQARAERRHFEQGIALMQQGKLYDALEEFYQVVEANPRNADAWFKMGVIYQKLGDDAKAMGVYGKVLGIAPDYSKVYYNLGVIYAKSRSTYPQAIEMFTKYLELEPDSPHREMLERWIMDKKFWIKLDRADKKEDALEQSVEELKEEE